MKNEGMKEFFKFRFRLGNEYLDTFTMNLDRTMIHLMDLQSSLCISAID